jgi:hypothetical protein
MRKSKHALLTAAQMETIFTENVILRDFLLQGTGAG